MQAYNLPWNPYRLDTYGRTALGAVDSMGILGSSRDPIFKFGQRGANAVIAETRRQPPAMRKAFLKAVLDVVDPTLYSSVSVKASQLIRMKRMSPTAALEKALSISMANGLANETISRIAGRSSLSGYADLAGFWGTVKKVAKWSPPGLVVRGGIAAGKQIGKGAKKAGKAVASAAKKVGSAAKAVLKKVGDLACTALNSGLAETALASAVPGFALATKAVGGKVIARASGKQIAGAAASTGRSLCSRGEVPVEEPTSGGSMTIPIVAGGGILAALLLL